MTTRYFRYECGQYVTIKVFGLNCHGRVVRQIVDSDCTIYDVHYAINGELRRAEFFEDELDEDTTEDKK